MSNPVVIHSKLSFSGRERWRNCPASVAMSAGMPDNSSPAAAEGTAAHTVAEWYVRQLGEAYGLPPVTPAQLAEAPDMPAVRELDRFAKLTDGAFVAEERKWNEEMRTHGKAYRAFILSLIPAGEQAFISLEVKVQAKSISEHLFGTADCLIWLPRLRRLIVVDYKYGFMLVEIGDATNPNPQLAAYAIAALDQCTLDATGGVTLAVFQPRRSFGAPAAPLELPHSWIKRERDALALEVVAVEMQQLAYDLGNSRPVAGDHCRYCKGKSKCPQTMNALAAVVQAHSGAFDMLAIPTDDLITLWAARTAFKAFWEDVEERVEQEVKKGNPRLTVKETQGRRMWADPKAAALTLMALGKTELLAPCAVSEALPHLPDDWQKQLIRNAQPSRSIRLVTDVAPSEVAKVFAKYANGGAKPVDKS